VIDWLRMRLGAARRHAGVLLSTPGAGSPVRDTPREPRRATVPEPRRGRTAVVAACYDFPIYSHSFVYQEMLSLKEMGLDLRLFCWRRADPSHLHAAFSDLWDRLHVLESTWARHVADYRYYQARMPQHVAELMERLSESLGQPVERLESDYEVLMAFTFTRAVEDAGADYLHTYFFYEETFFALVASYLLGVPRGVSCYADHMLADSRFKDVPFQLAHVDVAVATSRRIAGELRALAGDEHAHKILVKPNGVDGRRFEPRERREELRDPVELLSVSRIEPKKGLLHLCDVARSLADRGRRVRIHVVGAPDAAAPGAADYARAFAERRRAVGVEEAFVMHGFMPQERLGPLLALADAFVAPYVELESGDKDGIPTSLLEAMAAGLPAVCSDAGSIREVIADGVEGFVVPASAPEPMARALLRLCDEPGLARRMGLAAHARFQREFDARVTEPLLHARIERILAARRVPAVEATCPA
jgi:colanic acid/amylovoran biosynthesis glycosyltransferase